MFVCVCVCMPNMFPNSSGTFCTLSAGLRHLHCRSGPGSLIPGVVPGTSMSSRLPSGGASPARAPCLEAGSSSGGPEVTLQGLPSCPRSLLLAHEVGGPPVSHSLQQFQVRTRGIRQITPQREAAKRRRNLSPPHDLGLEKGKKKKIHTSMSAETPFLLSPQPRH